MEIIVEGSNTGMLEKLIRKSAEKNAPIICINSQTVLNVISYSKVLGVEIPLPIQFTKVLDGNINSTPKEYLIHQIDLLVPFLLNNNKILMASTLSEIYPSGDIDFHRLK